MAIDWLKVPEGDRGFHERMVDSPFGSVEEYVGKYGNPKEHHVYDLHGLKIEFYFWDIENSARALLMRVEDEPFEDVGYIKTERTTIDIMQEYLDGFQIPPDLPVPRLAQNPVVTVLHFSSGLNVWAEGRHHLFHRLTNDTITVRSEFLLNEVSNDGV